jgi:hypothetical protein
LAALVAAGKVDVADGFLPSATVVVLALCLVLAFLLAWSSKPRLSIDLYLCKFHHFKLEHLTIGSRVLFVAFVVLVPFALLPQCPGLPEPVSGSTGALSGTLNWSPAPRKRYQSYQL